MTDQHVSEHKDGSWRVKGAGHSRASSKHSIQSEATAAAVETAKKQGSEVVVHGRDRKIRAKDRYGNDFYLPKEK
ncbi:DUF2188 domain-containing protein [Domibacillus sp. A3M-37]|uniref:DUF2188 domain-containing protein n=1 Tax=Domibacillus sp. A3M-37 TaxID=2962037 RepID=UPI0020B89D43|nr:DUF2188 domain-containing protein [Domibacillus sp. A3M-37]MCP3761554.1 DUF2188 domain-containing protein [Domibacillus sp. A3M-37]